MSDRAREMEIRKRRKLQRQRYLRRRRKRRILLFLLLVVMVGIGALIYKLVDIFNKPIIVDPDKIPEITGEALAESENPVSEDGRPVDFINLTEAEKYTGDLILVNSSYEYHFEENASEINLISLDTYKDGAIPVGKDGMELAEHIMEPLFAMITDCNEALDVDDTGITSAYRTKEYQQNVFEQYEDEYGLEYAQEYVSDPGHSEHHTGISLDMGIYYNDGGEGTFSGSSNAQWIDEHCEAYGFIRRFKEDKTEITGISNESWHFRYVGIPHATYMNENNLCLEEYITYLRENTSADNPLIVTCGENTYSIYATKEMTIVKPEKSYTISGDNIDGYIITALTDKIEQIVTTDDLEQSDDIEQSEGSEQSDDSEQSEGSEQETENE